MKGTIASILNLTSTAVVRANYGGVCPCGTLPYGMTHWTPTRKNRINWVPFVTNREDRRESPIVFAERHPVLVFAKSNFQMVGQTSNLPPHPR